MKKDAFGLIENLFYKTILAIAITIAPLSLLAQQPTDEPLGAPLLTVGLGNCAQNLTINTANFTPSVNPGPAGCAANTVGAPKPDGWFIIEVPTTGVLFLSPAGTVDAGMAAYTYDPTSNTFTLLGCDDDTGPGLMPQLNIITQPVGTPIYVQLWAYGGGTITFDMCSQDCNPTQTLYQDLDGDGFGNPTVSLTVCPPPAGYVSSNTDCNDNNPAINTSATEDCTDPADNDCDGTALDCDIDLDGFLAITDCNDNDPLINPAATEDCNDAADNDCDGSTIDCDGDGDGFDASIDCNDNCEFIFPGSPCDDGDNNTVGDILIANCVCQGFSATSGCVSSTAQTLTFNGQPNPPTTVGTSVNICYSLNYNVGSGDWLDGIVFSLGSGWSTPTPLTAPNNCGGGAPLWIWQNSITPNSFCGIDTGPGYYFDFNNNGNGGDDFGDFGNCTFTACATSTILSVNDLTVSIITGGDSYFGNYTGDCNNPQCPPNSLDYPAPGAGAAVCQIILPACVTPTDCDVNNGTYSLLAADGNTISIFNPPAGPLVVSLNGIPVQVFMPPFASTLNLNISPASLAALNPPLSPAQINSLLAANGQTYTLSASFPASPTCNASKTFDAPAPCCSLNIPPASVVTTCVGAGMYDVQFEFEVVGPPTSGNLTISTDCALGVQNIPLPDATLTDLTPNVYTFNNILLSAPAGLTPPYCELELAFTANPNCTLTTPVNFTPPISVVNVSATQGTCIPTVNGSENSIILSMTVDNPPTGATDIQIFVDGVDNGLHPLPPNSATGVPSVITLNPILVENPINPNQFDHEITFTFGSPTNNCIVVNDVNNPIVPPTNSLTYTFTGPAPTFDPHCSCSITINSVTPSDCFGYGNRYNLDIDFIISNPPASSNLFYFVGNTLTPPVQQQTSPVSAGQINLTLADLNLNDNAAAFNQTLIIQFDGFIPPASCEATFNYIAPAACNCASDVGTFSTSSGGAPVADQDPTDSDIDFTLCFGESIVINSFDDYTPSAEVFLAPTSTLLPNQNYQPGLGIAIYPENANVVSGDINNSPANLSPLIIIEIQDITGNPLNDFSIANDLATQNTLAPYFGVASDDEPFAFKAAIVTLYSTSSIPIQMAGNGTQGLIGVPESAICGNVGDVYTIKMVPSIQTAGDFASCMNGTYALALEEGDPLSNTFNWSVTTFSPANLIVSTMANGDSLQVSGLLNGDNLNITLADADGCTVNITHGPFVGPVVGSVSLPPGINANGICASTTPFQLVGNSPNGTWSIDMWSGPGQPSPYFNTTNAEFSPSEDLAVDPIVFNTIYFLPSGCGTISPPFNIAVQPTVVPFSAPLPALCENNPQLDLTFFGGPPGGAWQGTGVQTNNTFNPSLSGPGTFTLTYDVSAAPGVVCGTINAPLTPIQIIVNDPSPAIMTPSLTSGCEDLVVSVYSNSINTVNCNWKIDGVDVAGNCDSLHTTLMDPTCYDFTLITTDNNNCKDTLEILDLICVLPTPEVSFISSPPKADLDDPEFFFYNTSPNLDLLEWDFAGFGSSNETEPSFTFQDATSAGAYTVCLLGTDIHGCQNTYCNDVVIEDPFMVFTPTAITPDNDNLNEAFRPVITGKDRIKNYKLRVFDRWGNTVFESTDMNEYWNANNAKGDQYVVNGVYHWIIDITLEGLDATRKFEGSLSIIR